MSSVRKEPPKHKRLKKQARRGLVPTPTMYWSPLLASQTTLPTAPLSRLLRTKHRAASQGPAWPRPSRQPPNPGAEHAWGGCTPALEDIQGD